MAANKPQDKASSHADRLQKLIDSGWSPDMAKAMLANDADVMEKSGPTSGSSSSSSSTPSSDKTKTPKKKKGTILLNYDEAKTNPKLRERFNNTPNANRDNYKDADFIKGGASAADRKAYAIKLANSTIKKGMSAADQAAIRKAREWYTGQTKGGKKAGWSDDSLKSIRRGKDDKGKVGTTTKAKAGTSAGTAGTTKDVKKKDVKKPVVKKPTPVATEATTGGRTVKVRGPGKTRTRVPKKTTPESPPTKPTKNPKTTTRRGGVSGGIKAVKPKKSGDSWKEQRAPKRLNKLQHATAQIAHDRVGDAKVKARRAKRQLASSERSGATSSAKSGTRFGNALSQGKEPEGFAPLTNRVNNWLENPGEATGKTKRSKVTNPAFDRAAQQRKEHHAATVAALAAHGSPTPMGKEKRKKLPGAGR